MASGPLDGVRVLEFTQIIAGPLSCQLLADLGADVIKIEPPHGEPWRLNAQFIPLESKTYQGLNRGKRSLAIDLAHPDSRQVVYKLLEDIEAAMVGLLAPEFEEVVTGDAEVREIFSVPRIGKIAGCYVTNGVITRNSKVRFLREGTIIWKGKVQSLRRFKDDAAEVAAGYECGIGLSDFQDLKEGDVIETYDERQIERTLDS